MYSKLRSFDGCWTCRVRRKKCAENRPVCDTCQALQITCYYEEEKPPWMDGGVRQTNMMEEIKAQTKRSATQKRKRKHLETLQAEANNLGHIDTESPATDVIDKAGTLTDFDPSPGHLGIAFTSEFSNDSGSMSQDLPMQNKTPIGQGEADKELHLLMIYLDYVFPYLFPHYRSSILAGGRGWILEILHTNKAVYHSAISLSTSFYALVLNNSDKAHDECTMQMIHKFESQIELCLKELHKEVDYINTNAPGFDLKKELVLMQSILQMLFFEVATSNKDNWKLHFNAAIAVFLRILPDPKEWNKTLNSLFTHTHKWPPPEFGPRRPWTTNQAALRFFTATILYIDILSSITLGNVPQLASYHASIVPECLSYEKSFEATQAGYLCFDEFFGLRNWIVQILGDVASLEEWKRMQKKSSSLQVSELESRGKVLSDVIQAGIQSLESHCQRQYIAQDVTTLSVGDSWPDTNANEQPKHEMVWLLATLSYLNVVILGWQPSHQEIRWSVAKATDLLCQVPKGPGIRTLAWPMCISGCLSLPEDEAIYRALVRRLGPLEVFGTMKEALLIMETVWSMRADIDESWDIAKCMNVLGYSVLLI
ncbi:fungal-specific transcription factor domain-containing protein [Trichoderma pleuroticola]